MWIQLAGTQYVCRSGSQVEQLATTIPLLHVHNHHQTETMTARDPNGVGAYRTSHQLSYSQIISGQGASIMPVLTHIQAKGFHTICNSIIAAACERDCIPS